MSIRIPVCACLAFWLLVGVATAQNPAAKPTEGKLDQAALEKQFAEKLSGCVLKGSFTTLGKNGPPATEKYTIVKAVKGGGDLWRLDCRMQYGKTDSTVPIVVPVKWSGDTPVITLDELTIPGMGTFSARVLIHGDRYAGTWQHGKSGGHMFGLVERLPPETPKPAGQ